MQWYVHVYEILQVQCFPLLTLLIIDMLQVVAAVRADNFAAFFELYQDAPRMVPYLMDAVAARVR